ncbi:MAG: FAD-dependent oxidoreductase [Acidobacteria bacterium]|nr:MAG: FAD-dependent oxidoreductase [Acidobacteriota bacterium]
MTAIVIGAGIGGLAMGIALKRAGVSVEIHEQSTALREVGAGISLWANALRCLDAVGAGDAVRRGGIAALTPSLYAADGTVLARPHASLAATLGTLALVIDRAELLRILAQAFGDGVTLGAACTGFDDDDRGVTARFADGRTARGDLLVGADGLHSIVRAQLHGDAPPRYAGHTAWRAVVRFPAPPANAGEFWGRGARFGWMPSTGGVYWYATQNAEEGGRSADGERAALLRLFGHWSHPIPALVEATADAAILRNDIYDRPPIARWGRGRVTLAGDAAHPMTPNLGQGACQAIEDAVVLANCVREILPPEGGSHENDKESETALRAYERLRAPRANAIVRQSRQIGWLGQLESPLLAGLRDRLVGLAPRLQTRALAAVIDVWPPATDSHGRDRPRMNADQPSATDEHGSTIGHR